MELPQGVTSTIGSKVSTATSEQDDLSRRLAQLRQLWNFTHPHDSRTPINLWPLTFSCRAYLKYYFN